MFPFQQFWQICLGMRLVQWLFFSKPTKLVSFHYLLIFMHIYCFVLTVTTQVICLYGQLCRSLMLTELVKNANSIHRCATRQFGQWDAKAVLIKTLFPPSSILVYLPSILSPRRVSPKKRSLKRSTGQKARSIARGKSIGSTTILIVEVQELKLMRCSNLLPLGGCLPNQL